MGIAGFTGLEGFMVSFTFLCENDTAGESNAGAVAGHRTCRVFEKYGIPLREDGFCLLLPGCTRNCRLGGWGTVSPCPNHSRSIVMSYWESKVSMTVELSGFLLDVLLMPPCRGVWSMRLPWA